MEPVVAIALFLGFLFVVSRIARWNSRKPKYLDALKARFSEMEIKQTFLSRFGLTRPRVKFDYGRTDCELMQGRTSLRRGSRTTTLRLAWPDRNFACHLATVQSHVHFGGNSVNTITIEDNPAFQSKFYTCASSIPKAAQLLSSQVQWKLEQLANLCQDSEFTFSILDGTIKFRRNGWFKKPADLEDFVHLSLEVFDQMMLVNAKGLEFLHDNEAAVVHDVKCPICSDDIMHEMVVCQRCKSPHCLDCWDYNGKCATFACNETRYLRVNSQVAEQ